MQVKKKLKNKLNGIGLKPAKLLLQLISCVKNGRKLNVYCRQLNIIVLQQKKNFNMLAMCKLGKSLG
jgi:hypothetical protein